MQGKVAEQLANRLDARRQRDSGQALLVQLGGGVVVCAPKITAQQVVACVTLVLHHTDHTAHRHTDQRQRVAGQHQAGLNRFRHHLGGTGSLELFEIAVVHRAHNHRHRGRVGACIGQHLERAGGVQVGHHHGAGTRQTSGHQRLQAHRVAKHHRVAGGSGLPHPVRVQVQRHVGNAFALQHVTQILATAAIAADDHVFAGVDGLARNRGHLQRLLQPLAGDELHHDAVAVHDDERGGQHRQHHAGQNRVEQLRRNQVVTLSQRQQHKAEFTSLRQVQTGAQRDAGSGAQALGQRGDHHQLEQHRYAEQQQHQWPTVQYQPPVQHHADADEKQAQQDIVKRADIGFYLVLVFGLGNQHAGDKSAQRQAEPRQLRQPGQRQGDQQQVEHKQLFALAPGHQCQPPAHDALAAGQQQTHQHGRLEAGNRQRHQQLVWRRAQSRNQHQQGHHRQILKQQHTHDPLAVLGIHLQPLGQQLDHHCCAAHRHGTRQRQRSLPGHVPQRRRQRGQKQ